MPTPFTFYFDYISPFAYVGWHAIQPLYERADVEVRPVPVLFAGLLNHHGTKGPAEVPAKRRYIFIDALRKASVLGIPLKPPPSHPFNPLLALRVSGLPMPEDTRRALITKFYDATWATRIGVTEPDRVEAMANEVGVPDAIARASEQSAKDAIRDNTNRAIAEGVFGVPTMFVKGQMFWGVDSVPHLVRLLDGDDPVSAADPEQWADLPASAHRKR